MTLLRNITGTLPMRLVSCALSHLAQLPFTPELLKTLSPQITVELPHRRVALLSRQNCVCMLQNLKANIQFVTKLPLQRRQALMDGLILCLGLAGVSSPQKQFVVLGPLTPFLNASTYLSIYRGILTQNVQSITDYCYPPETQPLLTSLLQEPQMFGNPTQWEALLLQRMDRLIFQFPERSLKSINMDSLSSRWVLQMLSEDNKWKISPLGAACFESESSDQRAARVVSQRTLLRLSIPAQSLKRSSLPAPDCKTLRGSPASAWGADILVRMTPTEFMDCLEYIGQNRDISSTELKSLLNRFLEINGPLTKIPPIHIARLGRLATKFSVSQLKLIPLKDMQLMEVLGRESEWTIRQMQALVNGFLTSRSLTVHDLDAVHLVALGYSVCGLNSAAVEQLQPYEFCSAVLHLGSLLLACTEQQLHAFTRLCTRSDIFGPVSDWTEEVFREMGSVAAGLQDLELSSLVLEQIQGLSPLALSLMPPIKFAVSFSAIQLRMFSWSQALGVTNEQKSLLDNDQQKALWVTLVGEDNGTQDYRAGISKGSHNSLSMALGSCILFSILHTINVL
uniref:Stereocilin n=1 Tax=Leptobrachium leishanense TaxID=445787 RepID=A0A8C5PIY2_9ANUR